MQTEVIAPANPIVAKIAGNATDEEKHAVVDLLDYAGWNEEHFAIPIAKRIRTTEINVNYEEVELKPGKVRTTKHTQCIFEIEVARDMCNFNDLLMGACSAFLLDICSSTNTALYPELGWGRSGASAQLNITYHAPAPLGSTLRVISSTITSGAKMINYRSELWDVSRKTLVASSTHMIMAFKWPTIRKPMPQSKL